MSGNSSNYLVPKAFAVQRPATNSFKVSFDFLIEDSNYMWPRRVADSYLISSWLSSLSKSGDLEDVLKTKVLSLPDFAHHQISEDQFSGAAKAILKKLRSTEEFAELNDYPIYSLRYCYRDQSPERLLAVARNNILYVLWWDKNHKSYGVPLYDLEDQLCDRTDCLHPSDYVFFDN